MRRMRHMTRALVTGGSGFIGSKLVHELSRRGYDVRSPRHNEMDITEEHSVREYFDSFKPEWVFNLAGYRGNDAAEAERLNVMGTRNILDASRRVGAHACIHAGTCIEYGDAPTPFTEEGQTHPVEVYGISKLRASELVIDSGIPAAVLRFTNVYGPNSTRDIVQRIRQAHADKTLIPVSDDIVRDYVFIDDAVSALLCAANHIGSAAGEIVNISSNQAIATADVVREAERIYGIAAGSLSAPEPYVLGANQQRSNQANNSKAARIIDWKPTTSFANGLRASLA